MPIAAGNPNQVALTRRIDDRPRGWFHRHALLGYTVIAYAVSWSLLIGGFFGSQVGFLNPEGRAVGLMIQVAAAGPAIAAVTILALTQGRAGLAGLGRSILRWRVHPLWYAFIFLCVPLLMLAAVTAAYADVMAPALTQNWSLLYTAFPLQVLSVTVLTGLAEEPGWRGYAQPTANRRYRPLVAALLVSVIWATWHLPNALFGPTVLETVTHLVATVVNGFVLAWAYNSTGSVLIVMLLHGAQNGTADLLQGLLEGSTGGPSPTTYYLISAVTFGVLMAVVAVRTRGQLGFAPSPSTDQAPRSSSQAQRRATGHDTRQEN